MILYLIIRKNGNAVQNLIVDFLLLINLSTTASIDVNEVVQDDITLSLVLDYRATPTGIC